MSYFEEIAYELWWVFLRYVAERVDGLPNVVAGEQTCLKRAP